MIIDEIYLIFDLLLLSATMTKIIKEMLPPDVRVARDTQDLLIECCVGQDFKPFYKFDEFCYQFYFIFKKLF